jgi:23S rRNA-/tRNA-specific pseudouridylate synthase
MQLRALRSPFYNFHPQGWYSHPPFSEFVVARQLRLWYAGILPILLWCHNVVSLQQSIDLLVPQVPSRWNWSAQTGLIHAIYHGGRWSLASSSWDWPRGVTRTRSLHTLDVAVPSYWCQEIIDAYSSAETDGIIQLGKSCNNPLQNLKSKELWQVTRRAAQQVSSRTNQRKNGAPDVDDTSWRGPAASMLNGWIAACSLNADGAEYISTTSQRAQYALDLFDIATGGDDRASSSSNASNRHSRAGGPSARQETTTVTPDLVTYSVLYTTLHPVDPDRADQCLQMAIRQTKKAAGTQRRKLLSSLGRKSPSSDGILDALRFFRDREVDVQNYLSRSHFVYSNSNDPDALVLHETENFVVLNKPSGVSCYHTHLTTSGKRNQDLSLVDLLMKVSRRDQLSTLNPDALGIVHRLDRGTSGCIVVAKNDPTHAQLVTQLFTRQLQKTYTVLVSPAPSLALYNATGYITIPVHGKPAKSKYTILERYSVIDDSGRASGNDTSKTKTAALINVTTLTGRQHQVRVHCAYGLGTPIVGDDLYSNPSNKGPMKDRRLPKERPQNEPERFHLHASSLYIPCANETIHAPLPSWWLPVLDSWRSGAGT